MRRRAAINNHIKEMVATIKDLIPDFFATFGILTMVFYLVPILIGILSATIQ